MPTWRIHRYVAGVEARAASKKGDFLPPEDNPDDGQFEELTDLKVEATTASEALQSARELTAKELGGDCDGIGFQAVPWSDEQ